MPLWRRRFFVGVMMRCLRSFLFVLLFLGSWAFADDPQDLASLKHKALIVHFSGTSTLTVLEKIQELSGSLDSSQVLLSFDEEFLLYCNAIQNIYEDERAPLWNHVLFLLDKRDSIVDYRSKKKLVGADNYREERHFAINMNYGALRHNVAYLDIPHETKEFFGIFLERLVLNYGGEVSGEFHKSEVSWNSFKNRYPESRWINSLPPASKSIADKAEEQHVKVAPKILHFALLVGLDRLDNIGNFPEVADHGTGWSIELEIQFFTVVMQLVGYGGDSDNEARFRDVTVGYAFGLSLFESRYFTADALLGIFSSTYSFDFVDVGKQWSPAFKLQADLLLPVFSFLDLSLRVEYLIGYSSFKYEGKSYSGAGQKLAVSAGIQFGKTLRSE